MCRFVAYMGKSIVMNNVLVKPTNSIVNQSLHARETNIPTNGDGFGVGWYAPAIKSTPGLFTSIHPAWNDRNLLHLTSSIESTCFFAHVRAASAGGVTEYNCHPFIYNELMFMHNGGLGNFMSIKRHLRHLLSDEMYNWIKGESDTEHLFALYTQYFNAIEGENSLAKMSLAFNQTLQSSLQLIAKHGQNKPSNLNLCITNGQQLLASRYTSDPTKEARTLYYSLGSEFQVKEDICHMGDFQKKRGCILVVSEKLNDCKAEWVEIPNNHLLLVDNDLSVKLEPILT